MRRFLLDLLKKLKESVFFKNLLVVMAGTGIAQVIGFLLSPVISRLFSPADFGISGSFAAVTGVITAGMTLGYDQAVMLPKEKEHALNIFFLSILCTILIAALCSLFCIITPGLVNGLMKTSGVWPLALLVITTTAVGINYSLQAWSIRSKAFKVTSASQMIRSLTTNASRLGFGFLKAGAPGLIISGAVGEMAASINMARIILPEVGALRGRVRWKRMKRLAKLYIDFPLYAASQNVINALSAGLPIFLLTRYFNISVTGAYAFGITVLSVPMGFITGALKQVLFQKASESAHQGGSLAALYVKVTAILFAMVLVPSVILIIWAPLLFSWVFGSQWQLAGEFARSLIIWLAVVFCNVPAVLFARIIRIQRFVFFYDLALLAARTVALVLGGLLLNAHQTVMAFALAGALMNAFLIFYVGRSVMKKEGAINLDSIRDLLTKE